MFRRVAWLRRGLFHTQDAFSLAWRSAPTTTSALVALALVTAFASPCVAYVGKLLVDQVMAARAADPVKSAAAVQRAVQWVAAEFIAILALTAADRSSSLCQELMAQRLGIETTRLILRKALALTLSHFETPDVYDKLSRARREALVRPASLVRGHVQVLRNALALGGYLVLLAHLSGWMTLALLAAAIPAFVAETRSSAAAFRLRNWRSPDTRRLNYLEHVLATDEHAKEVRTFGLGAPLLSRHSALAERFFADDRALAIAKTRVALVLTGLSSLSFYACYAYIVVATCQSRLTLGEMTVYLLAFRQGQQGVQNLLSALGAIYEDNLYMSTLKEYLAIPCPPTRAPSFPPIHAERDERGIRFQGLGFRYRDSAAWALRGVDLFIPAGQMVAFVGTNGAGKTTLIKLLLRLYEPTEGRLLLDGRDLREWNQDHLLARFSATFQDFNRYQMALRENVMFGDISDSDQGPKTLRAVERAGVQDFARGLARGIDTQLGSWFKGGVELSGGQWQRVALARALRRERADILVLDEPTAALDVDGERRVFERLEEARGRQTVLLISHHIPTIRAAERIVVFSGGRIVEDGVHHDLLRQKARYAELFHQQSLGFR